MMEYNPATDPAMKPVTKQDIIDALEDNRGLKRVEQTFFSINDDGEIIGACALGLMAINLEVDPDTLYENLNIRTSDDEDADIYWYGDRIALLSDEGAPDYEIQNHIKTFMDFTIYVGKHPNYKVVKHE